MSTYLSSIAQENKRQEIIRIVNDMRNGNSFIHYAKRYIGYNTSVLSEEEQKQMYVSYGFMNKVINMFVSFCPVLTHEVP
ncbi:MAG: hypothetical protein ACRCRT_00185, partial [Cetobacterium somerae]